MSGWVQLQCWRGQHWDRGFTWDQLNITSSEQCVRHTTHRFISRVLAGAILALVSPWCRWVVLKAVDLNTAASHVSRLSYVWLP